MKVLLVAINAKYIHSNLAVYSLKSYAEAYAEAFCNKENKIELAEYTINQYSDMILRDIYLQEPDIIGFSCYIWNISMVEELLENIHKVLPKVQIWLGGPEVSYIAETFLRKHGNVKGIMRGEGEEIFKNLLETYAECQENPRKNLDVHLSEIRGISYKKEDNVITNEDERPVDMSKIPFVYSNLKDFENRIVYYESSRGCPFSCSYCLSSIDKHLRFREIEIVKSELKFFLDNKTAQVKFVDRTFNCKKEHAIEIWKFIRDNDNGITNFHFEIAADLMTEEEIAIISTMRPGLIQLEIGVQTTNPKTIDRIHRKMDFRKVSEIVEKLKAAENVHLHLDLIAGLPEENLQSFRKSFNMVYALKTEQLQLGFLKVLHGSDMKLQVKENGIKFQSRPPYEVLSTKWLGFDEVLKLKKVEEVLEIYYNSGQFVHAVMELEKYFQTPFEMYERLGAFYAECGIHGEKHSRIERYHILLDFYEKIVFQKNKDNRKRDIFKQLLIYDIYLRDNIKSRPEFAYNLEAYKKAITDIYKKEQEQRRLLPDYQQYNSKQLAKMTHLEVFDFDIEKYVKTEIDTKEESFVIFDYKKRNPLNYGARVVVVKEELKGSY